MWFPCCPDPSVANYNCNRWWGPTLRVGWGLLQGWTPLLDALSKRIFNSTALHSGSSNWDGLGWTVIQTNKTRIHAWPFFLLVGCPGHVFCHIWQNCLQWSRSRFLIHCNTSTRLLSGLSWLTKLFLSLSHHSSVFCGLPRPGPVLGIFEKNIQNLRGR